jgi:hypothetical protein
MFTFAFGAFRCAVLTQELATRVIDFLVGDVNARAGVVGDTNSTSREARILRSLIRPLRFLGHGMLLLKGQRSRAPFVP